MRDKCKQCGTGMRTKEAFCSNSCRLLYRKHFRIRVRRILRNLNRC